MNFKLCLRAFCAFALLFGPLVCRADTLKLISTTGGSSGGAEVYPYNFSVDGSSQLTSLACLNFNREVSIGEQWQVTIHSIGMTMSQTDINYRADAVLDYAFGKYNLSNSDVQYAIWSIFDPAVTGNSAFTSTSRTLANLALQYAVNTDLMSSGFFQNFSLYTPTTNQTGWTNGMPQEFIGAAATVAATPEPSSVVLLGTALLCAGAVWFRRRTTLALPLAC